MLFRTTSPLFTLSFFTLSFAINAATPVPECANAQRFLEGKLAFWQPRMELQTWKISVVMTRARDLRPRTLGNIHWDRHTNTATIRVLDAADYKLACPAMLADMEFTLVHELVHLEISSLPRSSASRGEEERAVNRITHALLLEEPPPDTHPAVAALP